MAKINSLVAAMQTENTYTENGMVTNSSSLNECVNLFFQIGAMRNQPIANIVNAFSKAFHEDALTAVKLAFWVRDVRGGSGERKIFREICKYLATKQQDVIKANLSLIPEYGRWDDLLVFVGTRLQDAALAVIVSGLEAKNGLCAKWMPRTSTKDIAKRNQANALRKYLKMTPKEYRKLLVSLSDTVEQKMCSKNWDGIVYSKLPSKAISGYMKAFGKRDYERFTKYLESLKKGETKINAGAVYPYDILKNLMHGNVDGADEQWKALPNYLEGSTESIMPIVDVSGSMYWPESKVSGDLYAGHVAQSLGLYISERTEGAFKNTMMTFHSTPSFFTVNGDLSERYYQLKHAGVGGSTDIEAVFRVLLRHAVAANVPAEEMPTVFLILSDMEFNRGAQDMNLTAQQLIEKMYNEAGYKMPKVVYWHLCARNDNFPVKFDKKDTAMVSGFSPAILKSILNCSDLNPYSMMMEVVNSERYASIKI